ncbi:hypothetical protein Ancab_031397, partial [Ancistrocladus abbreviatus]
AMQYAFSLQKDVYSKIRFCNCLKLECLSMPEYNYTGIKTTLKACSVSLPFDISRSVSCEQEITHSAHGRVSD